MTRFRLIAGLVGLVLIILLVLFVTGTLRSMFTAKQEARVAKGQQGAATQAGGVAVNIMGNVMEADDAIDKAVKGGTDEIRTQPAGNSNDAALRAACRLPQYVNSERCARLRGADPANAARPNPAR
jgi:predicted lipid-binding transport protein (Tim44 family)